MSVPAGNINALGRAILGSSLGNQVILLHWGETGVLTLDLESILCNNKQLNSHKKTKLMYLRDREGV